jgi:hypothetical protein
MVEVAHGVSACRHMRLKPFGDATEFIPQTIP